MDGLFDRLSQWFSEWMPGWIESFFGWLADLIKEYILTPFTESCLEFGQSTFNSMTRDTLEILSTSPAEWNKAGWSFIINNVNVAFIAVGSALVVVFYLIGLCEETLDIRHEIRLEAFLWSLIKLSLAEFFVVNAANIITALFGFITDLCSSWWNIGKNGFSIGATISTAELNNLPIGNACLTALVALVTMVALIGSGGVVIYTAYMRFFKIMMLVPYGALASSTIAGSRTVSHTAVSFYKYAIGTVLEAVTMILALCLFVSISGNGGISLIDLSSFSKNAQITARLLNQCMLTLLYVGVMKGSGQLTQRFLGL